MAPPNIAADDKKALEEAIAKMVKSDAWKKLLEQREWVDLYLPSEPFTAFVKEEQVRIGALLKELGLA
jgi:putative tricarboxylic transport membrane protein